MNNILSQLPTLLGVTLGAAGAMLGTTVTDRIRWRRDQRSRWDQRRLDAYTTFAVTLKEIYTLASRWADTRGTRRTAPPIDRKTYVELMSQAETKRTLAWESVLLLGDTKTVNAARVWRDAIYEVASLSQEPNFSEDKWPKVVNDVNKARDGFYLAARQSLNVNLGPVEQEKYLLGERSHTRRQAGGVA